MKSTILLLLLALPLLAIAQSFPTDAKVIEDVKKYHGKIATANVQNEWKLEREAGYTFSNMAKRVVAATTIKEAGVSKNIIGLAIYVRGGAGESWNFSRYFVTSSETTGLKLLTEEEILSQTMEYLHADPARIFVTLDDIAWVYSVSFPEGLQYEVSKRDGDHIYKAQVEYELRQIDFIPFEGGLYRFKAPLEIYVRQVGSEYKAQNFSVGYRGESIQRTPLTEKQYNAMPTLKTKPFAELYGPQGPAIPGAGNNKAAAAPAQSATAAPASTAPAAETPKTTTTAPAQKKGITLPKIKIGIKN